MGTLAVNKAHKWDKNKYDKISLDWTNDSGEKTGSVSLVVGDAAAESVRPPSSNKSIDKTKNGKITNNTSQTISYTLA